MNKKLFAFLSVLTICFSAFSLSKNYRPVRIELGTIIPMEFGEFSQSGFGFIVEPKLNITDQLSAGLRAHWGIMLGDGATVMGSYMLKADYFLNTKPVRPYITFGLGINPVASVSADLSEGESVAAAAGNFFSLFPGIGINLGGFRLGAGVNLIFAKQVRINSEFVEVEESQLRPQLVVDLTGSILSRKKR